MSKFRLLPHLLVLLLIGCSTATLNWQADSGPGGIGGTGLINSNKPGNGGGIGGTGKSIEEGIGGTGRIAKQGDGSDHNGAREAGEGIGGTGIVGTITAFGSIWVNDAHIHFDQHTPITINQAPASSGELQLGQVVAVSSVPEVEAYQAKSIDIIHEVVGPINKLSIEQQKIEVLNQTIQLKDDTIYFDSIKLSQLSPDVLAAGTYIEVSGLRQSDGEIVASRIDIIEAPEQIQLIGELSQNQNGSWHINKQSIEIDALLIPEDQNKRILVSGYLENETLVAESIGIDSIELVLEDASELIYEGYYFEDEMDGLVTIGGMEFIVEELIEFSEEYDFDEPLRINAFLTEEGFYEAEDLLIELEHEEHYIDLLHDEEFDHEDMWMEEDYYNEEHEEEHHHEEHFEEDHLEDDEMYHEDDEHHPEDHFDDHYDDHYEDEFYEED